MKERKKRVSQLDRLETLLFQSVQDLVAREQAQYARISYLAEQMEKVKEDCRVVRDMFSATAKDEFVRWYAENVALVKHVKYHYDREPENPAPPAAPEPMKPEAGKSFARGLVDALNAIKFWRLK